MWVPGEAPIPDDLLIALREALAGRYAVLEEIGQGGTATVFRAREEPTGRMVAIKVIDPHLARILGSERFRREITILSQLTHPGILPLLAAGEERDLLYFVMPFITGETLRQRIERERQLPMTDAVDLMRIVLLALDAAHRANIVHRDIKPENILLQDGRPIVADFGIARAIERAGGDTLSSTGFAVGTPTYMSPEQAAGERQIDGRSDIYSAACVLYELLAGGPPFTGPTPRALQARHIHERPPSLRIVRPDLPPALEAVIEKALAKAPAARFGTAQAFADALAQAMDPRNTTPVAPLRRRKWALRAAAVVVLGLLGGTGWWVVAGQGAGGLDPNRYVVLPFRELSGGAPLVISGAESAQLITHSLGGYPDFHLVDPPILAERLQGGAAPQTISDALAIARDLGAGHLIWGDIQLLGDSLIVRAAIYPVGRGTQGSSEHRQVTFPNRSIPADGAATTRVFVEFAKMAYALVLPSIGSGPEPDEIVLTTSFYALQAASAGDSALARWDLATARNKYREALGFDPSYPLVNLRLGQVGQLAGDPTSEWRPPLEVALRGTRQLGPNQRSLAKALYALADRRYPEACQEFSSLIARDSLDVRAWFGLGDCQGQDDAVVPDSRSPSQYRFRSSSEGAIRAYRRALEIVPLAHVAYGGFAIDRLANRLFAESNQLRKGYLISDSSQAFGAFPELLNDTLATISFPFEEIQDGGRIPVTREAATERSRAMLLRITTGWTTAYPTSSQARRGQALALELARRLNAPGGGDPGALEVVNAMRSDASATGESLVLGAWALRLLIKASRFGDARKLADSLLELRPATDRDGQIQAIIALIVGRQYLAADLASRFGEQVPLHDDEGRVLPATNEMQSSSQRLLVFASIGSPRDSIRAILSRINLIAQARYQGDLRRKIVAAAVSRARFVGFPLLGPLPAHSGIGRAETAILAGNLAQARQELRDLSRLRRGMTPGTVSMDAVGLEVRLRMLAGDSTGAREELKQTLANLPSQATDFLEDLAQAGALTRIRQTLAADVDHGPWVSRFIAGLDSLTTGGDRN
ncbi:MAG: serine/threonine-protein kinase [Gemmatimonadales bacterium]